GTRNRESLSPGSRLLTSDFCLSEKGFTLIELIMVVVILGILGVMGADFISKGFEGFNATNSRISIYEEGKIALVRMEREIHNAVPNAIDLAAANDLRFGMIDEQAMNIASNIFGMYQENPPTSTITDLSGGVLPVGKVVSIYNRDWADFTVVATHRLYGIVNPAGPPMTLSKNMPPPRSSPQKRYYAVDRAIRYFLNGTTLERSQSPINSGNLGTIVADLTGAIPQPLARNVTALTFGYTAGTLTRNAVVTIDFTITRNGEAIAFHKEVHVRNVP
ncbi:MAG: prepilin-type N-terminal cleavage/methylation domain-containing protein, partial [Proteobacteria bacterium]|nr:prepilin-type N-terminal cleavage/methylation domain-containing protein [Pseudomonadota bacterium]